MKKILLFAATVLLLAVSCSMEDEVTGRSESGDKEKTVFYATTEGMASPEAKVYADQNLKVLWNTNDCISIFNNSNVNDKYMFDGEDGDNSGGFSLEEEGEEPTVPEDLDNVYAVYPYSATTQAFVDNGQEKIAADLPSVQFYRENSFGLGANTMVAVTSGSFLGFKNACGYLKFRFYGDNVTVKSIVFEGNNGEKIAGHAVITPSASAVPTVAMQSDATGVITMNSTEGVSLGTTSATATEFIFVIPPTTFENGFKVTVTDNIGRVFEKSSTRSLTISRNKIESMSAMKVTPVVPPTTSVTYTLVETQSALLDGIYIIAAANSDKAMGHLSGTIHTSEDVTKSGNTITLDSTSSVLPLILAKSGSYWTIQNADSDDSNYGNYLAWSSGNSSIETSGSYTWEISVSGGVATITSASTSSRSLQYNSGSPRFACYTSSQQPVALYKRSGAVYPVGISFATESYSFTKGSSEYNAFTGQTVTKDASDTRTVTYTISGTIGTVDSSTGTVALNGSAGEATVTATVDADATHSAGSVSYSISVIAAVADYDLLDNAFIGVSGTTYTDKSGLVGSSGRGSKYTTNSAGGNSAIQLRSDKSNSGIVTTSSGGYAYKIVVSWNSNTASGRTLQVYGKNTAYSSPSDLYSSSSQGTLLGTIVYGSSTELVITGDYAYIGLRSSSGAMWLDEIDVYWMDGEPSTSPVINVTSSNPISVSKSGGSQTISYTITNPVSGQSLTASTDVTWISNISVSSSTVTFTVAAQAAGASSRAGTVTLAYSGASSVQVGINQEAGEGGSQAANGWLELPAKTTGSDYYSNTFTVGGARNYTYLYQYSTYTTLWTAYPLYSATMGSGTAALGPYYPQTMSSQEDRGTSWAANPQFDKSLQVNVWSGSYGVNVADPPYVSDIYARGHNIPNSDRSANGSMQTQTYYATNSTPQIQNRFNGYIWNQLEQGVRAAVSDTIYVVTGATFHKVTDGTESITYITPQHDTGKSVPVPYYYWKVLLKVKRSGNTVTSASAIGFWFVHQQYNSNDYTPYAVSVDKVEEYTGFDFFVNLPSNLETTAEANTSWTTFKNF